MINIMFSVWSHCTYNVLNSAHSEDFIFKTPLQNVQRKRQFSTVFLGHQICKFVNLVAQVHFWSHLWSTKIENLATQQSSSIFTPIYVGNVEMLLPVELLWRQIGSPNSDRKPTWRGQKKRLLYWAIKILDLIAQNNTRSKNQTLRPLLCSTVNSCPDANGVYSPTCG